MLRGLTHSKLANGGNPLTGENAPPNYNRLTIRVNETKTGNYRTPVNNSATADYDYEAGESGAIGIPTLKLAATEDRARRGVNAITIKGAYTGVGVATVVGVAAIKDAF